jgi:hypothetical protein
MCTLFVARIRSISRGEFRTCRGMERGIDVCVGKDR